MRRLIGLLAALALATVACGGSSSSIEYKAPDESALFRIPADWHLYEADELSEIPVRPFVTNFGATLAILNEVGFDGAPGRGVTNLDVGVAGVTYPVGSFVVRSVGSFERDQMSRALLEQTVLWPEDFSVSEQGLVKEDFSFADFAGIRRVLPFQDPQTQQEGLVYFISVTDPTDTKVFSIAAGCSLECFETHREEIIGVVDSWLVNTRQ